MRSGFPAVLDMAIDQLTLSATYGFPFDRLDAAVMPVTMQSPGKVIIPEIISQTFLDNAALEFSPGYWEGRFNATVQIADESVSA